MTTVRVVELRPLDLVSDGFIAKGHRSLMRLSGNWCTEEGDIEWLDFDGTHTRVVRALGGLVNERWVPSGAQFVPLHRLIHDVSAAEWMSECIGVDAGGSRSLLEHLSGDWNRRLAGSRDQESCSQSQGQKLIILSAMMPEDLVASAQTARLIETGRQVVLWVSLWYIAVIDPGDLDRAPTRRERTLLVGS